MASSKGKFVQRCAYCGSDKNTLTGGHVLSKNLYPDSLPDAKRIMVPECIECKRIWEDAEPHFRNIIVSIWNPNEVNRNDSRYGKVLRSFEKKDGKRRVEELASLLKPEQVEGKDRHLIYPLSDDRFSIIIRRIVRV